jgi:hypothetical protein
MPVRISRSGRCPSRTGRRRPSLVNLSEWVRSQAATTASTACPNSVLAPLRNTSVRGSENLPGRVSWKTFQTVLPSAETAAMLFSALLASGQITMRKVDGWQSLAERPSDQIIDLAA